MKKLWDILLIVGVALVMGALMAAVFYVSAPSGNSGLRNERGTY